MKIFLITGHFEAENIDDALDRLGKHFAAVAAGEDFDIGICSFDIKPCECVNCVASDE